MKKQFKALALTIALMTTAACGAKEAQAPQTEIKAVAQETKAETKVAAIESPQTGVKEQKKVNTKFLIPQTVELAKSEAKNEEAIELAEETTEVAANFEAAKEVKEAPVAKEEAKQVAENSDLEVGSTFEADQQADEYKEVAYSFVAEEANEEEIASEFVEENVELATLARAEENSKAVHEIAPAVEEESVVEVAPVLAAPAPVVEEAPVAEVAPVVEETPVVEAAPAVEEAEANQAASGLTVKSPSIEEVRAYWTNYTTKSANTEDFYGIQLVNHSAGQIDMAAQDDALHLVNTLRFATGLKEMTIGSEQVAYAQAATVVNQLNQSISHTPSAPAGLDQRSFEEGYHGAENSNLASNYGLLDAVLAYFKDDIGSYNQLEVGHRRWMVNPSATQTGFGQTEEYNAMFVNNNDYQGQNADEVVAYPGETAISEFHSENSSLSLQFGENFDISNAQVTVTDLATGEVREDSHIDLSFKGNGRAITFGNGMNFAPGTKLQVKVTGVTRDNVDYPIEYTINYMSIAK